MLKAALALANKFLALILIFSVIYVATETHVLNISRLHYYRCPASPNLAKSKEITNNKFQNPNKFEITLTEWPKQMFRILNLEF
jgi:uncharacterized protein (DUF1499 family)